MTHPRIDPSLVGRPTAQAPGSATVELLTLDAMRADDEGLVHGGFVFGAADYAAMLAVDDPYVVLGAADVRFVAPVRVGEVVTCEARRVGGEGKKHVVEVACRVGERAVLTGTLTTFVLARHVLG